MQIRYRLYSDLFRAAGNIHRTAILFMLRRGSLTLPAIIRRLKISPSLTAHHLAVLRKAGWVNKAKFGKLVEYSLEKKTVKKLLSPLSESD